MNFRLILKTLGNLLRVCGLFTVLPFIVSLIHGGEDAAVFAVTTVIMEVIGTLLTLTKPEDKHLRVRDAFFVAGISWVLLSVFGALPLYFSGYFNGFVDCFFESVSGFTTTGSTILTNIEVLPRGIVFWRSLTHWIGGMGVLSFMMAVMPSINASSVNLLKAESTGPAPDKIVPKIQETARIIYLIYIVMTVLLILLLKIAGYPLFDAVINAFSTAGTGGFSSMNSSIAAYGNPVSEVIITVFLFLFGINFSLYFVLIGRNFKKFFFDEELRTYFGVVIVAILIITVNISGLYGSFEEALRYSSFQVTSVISTAGFMTADYNLWPTLSKVILMFITVTGCCAGSTGGGMKLVRFIILFKAAKLEIHKILHPASVKPVSINGKKISEEMISKTALFFFVYFMLFTAAVLIISIEGKDIVSSATAVITSLSNVGPGLNIVGPAGNYSSFSAVSKIVLSVCMIAGRLEFFPVLILFTPSIWKKGAVT
ncbi:MAG: TrkH family potassium uptake protein [Oscillospiraceae bacterium]|jgi:trk system potassium uptake protein TrkH|nr:TrkH family potassium uptake protein [Oscillospiraceae bacterium]